MRSCAVEKYWKNIKSKKSNKVFKNIDFNNFCGINEILTIPDNGIVAFCGLNGVGKSTILALIKKIIGLNLSDSEKNKIGAFVANATFISDGNTVSVDSHLNSIKETVRCDDLFLFIDFEMVNSIHNRFISTSNLSEWLEQNENHILEKKEIDEINSIMGKNYQSIVCTELEYDDDQICPYFKVIEQGFDYGSEKMGKGEYFVLFLFWSLMNGKKNSTIVLDEPEIGISISSQKKLMDYLSVCICEKKFNLMITTHSPFILERLPIENIKIVVRSGSTISIVQPENKTDITEHLDLDSLYEGVFLVEDKTAYDYMLWILEKYAPYLLSSYMVSIASGGDSSIKEILSSAKKINCNPFVFLGIFDGDVRDDSLFSSLSESVFLPGIIPFEEEFRQYVRIPENRKKISQRIGVNDSKFTLSISKHSGDDYHDFFINVFKDLHLCGKDLISAYCSLQPEKPYLDFVEDLKKKIQDYQCVGR